LGIVPGRVERLRSARVPQIGWNRLEMVRDALITQAGLTTAYYANSYVLRPDAGAVHAVSAWSEHHGDRFPAAVRAGAAVGVQFHPEKSSTPGVAFLRAFLAMAARGRDGAEAAA